jgi:hypothetical protein
MHGADASEPVLLAHCTHGAPAAGRSVNIVPGARHELGLHHVKIKCPSCRLPALRSKFDQLRRAPPAAGCCARALRRRARIGRHRASHPDQHSAPIALPPSAATPHLPLRQAPPQLSHARKHAARARSSPPAGGAVVRLRRTPRTPDLLAHRRPAPSARAAIVPQSGRRRTARLGASRHHPPNEARRARPAAASPGSERRPSASGPLRSCARRLVLARLPPRLHGDTSLNQRVRPRQPRAS